VQNRPIRNELNRRNSELGPVFERRSPVERNNKDRAKNLSRFLFAGVQSIVKRKNPQKRGAAKSGTELAGSGN